MPRTRLRICFVCSGNICRSPTAEVVMRSLVRAAGIGDRVEVDSYGTGAWHVGQDMDRRSRAELVNAGYHPVRHVARQFAASDFATHDVVVALDSGHADDLRSLASRADDPATARESVVLLRSFDPTLAPGEPPDVADPYYGGASGFADVVSQVERGCSGLVRAVTAGRF